MPYIAPIVEGHGEIAAVPALLHRLGNLFGCSERLIVNAPIRVKAGSFLNDHEYFKKQVILATEKAAARSGSVLILLDCDDECPAQVGPRLLADAKAVRADVGIVVALAYREFESWFLAAAASLAGFHGLPENLAPPSNLEGIRDAKGWLAHRMPYGYDPIIHQRLFVGKFSLDQARGSPSFDRLCQRLNPLFSDGRSADPAFQI